MSRPGRTKTGARAHVFDDAGLERLLAAARTAPTPRPHTYQEIALAAGVTDAAVQDIVRRALRKLRHPAKLRCLSQ
jgi:DNA-directed RNA polymerase sigma subunit (sigma70/sigma32)